MVTCSNGNSFLLTKDMKRTILFFISCLCCCITMAQGSYTIAGCGQGKNGAYLVKVSTVVKDVKTARDMMRRDAVHGVLFRGFKADTSGGLQQKPLIQEPNVERTKADFFNAFWSEKKYERYAQMIATSFTSVKLKKEYEVSATFLVDKEALLHYLEDSGIIKGFSNVW